MELGAAGQTRAKAWVTRLGGGRKGSHARLLLRRRMGGLMGRAALFTTAVEATEAALRRRVTLPMDLARYTSAGMQNSAIARLLRDPESKLAQGSDKGAGAGASSPPTAVFL